MEPLVTLGKFITKVQLPDMYLRNLDSACLGGRLEFGALGVSVSLTQLVERECGHIAL